MKKKFWNNGMFLLGIVLILLGLGWALRRAFMPSSTTLAAPAVKSVPGAPPASGNKTDRAMVARAMDAIASASGFHLVAPIGQRLREAVDSGNEVQILRAFNDAVYPPGAEGSDTIPALGGFLNDPNPYVRYMAANDLFIIGSHDGYDTLVDLVKSDTAYKAEGQDVRIEAAGSLGKFREKDAITHIYDLFQRTGVRSLIEPLTNLGANEVQSLIEFFAETSSMKYYVLDNTIRFIPQITAVFQQTNKPDIKLAAAWALAAMANDQDAMNYLLDQARTGLANNGYPLDAIKYLGTLQSPEAEQVLESALDSSDLPVVEAALVNLLYNQSDSEKAKQVLIQRFNGGYKTTISVDLALELAAHSSDPQIQAAAASYAANTPSFAVILRAEKNRPIYNWIDNYVIKLKNPPPGP